MTRERRGRRPPLLVRALLRLLLPRDDREFYLGDLEERGGRPWLRELAGAAALRLSSRGHLRGRAGPALGRMVSDVRHGARRLLRAPAASLTVIAALSVGIGLSGLMFSLIHSALLPTLPFERGDRIVRVRRVEFAPITASAFAYWSERQRSFEGLAAWVERPVNLSLGDGGTTPVSSAAIDADVLPLLSVRPAIGRAFTDAEATAGAPAVVLLGHATWRTRFDGDAAVIGRTVRINGEPAEVIGVMPEGFAFPWNQELWTALRLDPLREERNPPVLSVFGVLRDGVSADVAGAELDGLDRQRPRPAAEAEAPAVEAVAFTNIINPPGQSYVLAGLMLGVALLVLLVACANATNVLLAQAVVRAREIAVRAALGASRVQIAAQLLAEVAILAVCGAAGGVLFAAIGVRLVRDAVPPGSGMPFWIDLRIDVPVLAFVASAAGLAALLAGVLPALHAARANRGELLKDASRGTSSRRLGRVMGRLIGAEMAVSFVLLIAAGLFVRSALNLRTQPYTFAPQDVLVASVRIPDGRYDDVAQRGALVQRLEASLAGVPTATSAALTTVVPGLGAPRRDIVVEGIHDPGAQELHGARSIAVSPGFFAAFMAPVLSGRDFDARDRADALPVAIVNRAFERSHLPAGAVGHRVAFTSDSGEAEWLTIVGVVPDLMAGGLDRELQEAVYRPLAQSVPATVQIVLRSPAADEALAPPLRAAVAAVGSDLALYRMDRLDATIDAANAQYAWLGALFLTAGALALCLAAIGLYGVMAFWVAQRSRELGVRMALGGGRRSILTLVLRQAMVRVATGILVGSLLAAPIAWLLRGVLLDVRPFDPVVFGSVLTVLLAAGWLGCLLPALRATRVDPQIALAAE